MRELEKPELRSRDVESSVALVYPADEVAGEHPVLRAAEAVEAGREAEAVGECLFEVNGTEDVLHVLAVFAHVLGVLVAVIHVFGFEDDAVDNRSRDGNAARHRNDHVTVGAQVHKGDFTEDVDEVENRHVGLEGHIVLDDCIGVIDQVEDVAAVTELDLDVVERFEVVEIEHGAEVALVQVGRFADERKVEVHRFGRRATGSRRAAWT